MTPPSLTTTQTGHVSHGPVRLIEDCLVFPGVEVWPSAYGPPQQQICTTALQSKLMLFW